jgi:hypothetical protein
MPPRNQQEQHDQDQADAEQKAGRERKHEAGKHAPGDFRVYRSFDTNASGGGRHRDQLVMVTGVNEDTGHVYGKPLGWADEGSQFEPGQLREVGTEPDEDDGGGRDGGG